MEFGNNAGNDLAIQVLRVFKWEVLETASKVDTPLAHDIIRGDLLRFRIVRCAPDDHIVSVGIPFDGNQSY